MDDIVSIFKQLFTPEQQVALLIITISVMSLLEVFKNIYFGFFPDHSKVKRKAVLWSMAFILGVSGGITGHYVGEPPQPLWFWMFVGAASGCGAICAYKVFVEIDWRGKVGKVRDALSNGK